MKIFCPICRKIFWLFLAKKVDFWIKIAIFIAFGYQNQVRARSGFSLNSRVWGRAGFEKSGFRYLVGFRYPLLHYIFLIFNLFSENYIYFFYHFLGTTRPSWKHWDVVGRYTYYVKIFQRNFCRKTERFHVQILIG